ncbi:hypothetical protein K7W42_15345 [Deinococcus sp. HMF7604]|uniref:hypothetical protein n=1 Tax=Deinococcus betulae TaxID=2873312 RepID=UPI001CCED5E9|nr:hypothetical protein [Deinococcus betulae]MBZ9752229.1 hypothetical protein [Deinococcus betulae]
MPHALTNHTETGEVLRRLGPFASAHVACTASSPAAGQVLMWSREAETWQAEEWPLRDTVEADAAGRGFKVMTRCTGE